MLLAAALLNPATLLLVGLSSSVLYLSCSLLLFGMTANLFNISVNTQAVGVERLYGKSIMASFHGLWSLAGFTGGLISMAMVAVAVNPFYHFCFIFLFSLAVLSFMGRSILPRDEADNKKDISYGKKKKNICPP